MRGIFDYDGILFQAINKVINCVFLSFLWFVFSIPLITMGASTTALYYTVNKVLRHGRSHIWREFWSSFKGNFKQATLVWMIFIIVCCVLAGDCYFTYLLYKTEIVPIIVLIAFMIFTVIAIMWGIYLFPYIARFSNTVKHTLKNCMIMMLQNLLWSVLLMVIFAVSVAFFLASPLVLLVIPVCCSFLQGLILERIFRRYMTPEDLEAERIRNCIKDV